MANTAGKLQKIWIELAEARTQSPTVAGKLRELAALDIEKVWNQLLSMALHGEYASERLEACKFLVSLGVASETPTQGAPGDAPKSRLKLASMSPEELRALRVLQLAEAKRAQED